MGKISLYKEVLMKKVVIILLIILIIAVGIYSISLGNEEIESSTPNYTTGTVNTEILRIRTGLSLENDYIGLLKKDDTVHIYRKS